MKSYNSYYLEFSLIYLTSLICFISVYFQELFKFSGGRIGRPTQVSFLLRFSGGRIGRPTQVNIRCSGNKTKYEC